MHETQCWQRDGAGMFKFTEYKRNVSSSRTSFSRRCASVGRRITTL
jgi:hypothetical protein